jgi:hypothetical protein
MKLAPGFFSGEKFRYAVPLLAQDAFNIMDVRTEAWFYPVLFNVAYMTCSML